MKFTDFPAPPAPVPPAPENGAHRAAKKNGAMPKRPVAEPLPAPFAAIETAPVDAQAWPLHSAGWLQQDMAPSAPAWTGLAVERHNSIPAHDFIHFDIAPLNRPDKLDEPGDPCTQVLNPRMPQSDLDPLGWDPRAVLPKEEPR